MQSQGDDVVRPIVQHIQNIGCRGSFRIFTCYMPANSDYEETWCVDPGYAFYPDADEGGKPVHFRKSMTSSKADLVLMMDVLEHIDDDVGLLREYVGKVDAETHFLISVPAFRFLWSGHDVFLEHRRRYRLHQIERVAEAAGLEVVCGRYYFGAAFPIAATIRLLGKTLSSSKDKPKSRLQIHSPLVNETLAFLSRAELPMLAVNRAIGLTAFVLAKRV